MLMPAKTQYTRSGDVHIAYQVVGDGPVDVVFVPGWVSHVELGWEEPNYARFLGSLASFSRLILFDKRGTGLSDRVPNENLPTLEERMDDVRVVMDAAGSEKAVIIGVSEGGNLSAYFAASHPGRVAGLILIGTYAKRVWSPDYPWAPTPEEREKEINTIEREWGELADLEHYAPSMISDAAFAERTATYLRRSASPGAAVALLRMNSQIDISNVLPVIQQPSLILHRTGDRDVNIAEARWIEERMSNAKLVELPGDDHFPWVGDVDALTGEIQQFVTGETQSQKT
ncbi:MAG: alpha/beta hydrolase, partial [Rhodobacteraceae bacterium]|nr:alpha/beta hydrolase [Paracoccaceae bacterium]